MHRVLCTLRRQLQTTLQGPSNRTSTSSQQGGLDTLKKCLCSFSLPSFLSSLFYPLLPSFLLSLYPLIIPFSISFPPSSLSLDLCVKVCGHACFNPSLPSFLLSDHSIMYIYTSIPFLLTSGIRSSVVPLVPSSCLRNQHNHSCGRRPEHLSLAMDHTRCVGDLMGLKCTCTVCLTLSSLILCMIYRRAMSLRISITVTIPS